MGRTFAALKNYQVDGNKEMMAIGVMNIAGTCSSCYVTTGNYDTFSFGPFYNLCCNVIITTVSNNTNICN